MKNLMKKFNLSWSSILIPALGLLLLGGGGCVSSIEEDPKLDQELPSEKIAEIVPEEVQKSLGQLREGTNLIMGLIQESPLFIEYLEAGTNLEFEGQHQILLTEIFNPESELNQNLKVKSKLETGKLNPVFNYAKMEFEKILGDDLRLYWPYFELYDSLDKNSITLTFNPLLDEDQNEGFRLIKENENWVLKDTVIVDDEYAFKNPVIIVDQAELLEENQPNSRKYLNADRTNSSLIPNCCSLTPLDGSRNVNKIYVNHIRLSENFRGLFGGDNKIIFNLSDENVSTTTPNSKNTTPVYISRYQGRRKVWVAKKTLIDPDWSHEQISKFIVVETDDSDRSTEFKITGTVKIASKLKVDKNGVAVELGPEASIGAEWTIKRDNEIRKFEYNRRQFFFENWQNAESRGIHSWDKSAIRSQEYRRGTLFYTFGVVSYNYPN
ncbi:hypothetical protein [uncultured Algoriphagus sp.]|uniref:hypothetical protein n=1 Tax=uncultured Algoriphagus sp. TaxID=417365 RepID=UPI002597F1DC|nr:hypothetical protein [uncultured Algoriphagus sp.]